MIAIQKSDFFARAASWSLYVRAVFVILSGCNVNDTVIGNNYTPTVDISYANSIVTTSQASIFSGSSATITLNLKDTNFNPFIVTDVSVSFQATGGTSTGTMGPTVNHEDGTYSAEFTGVTAGTPTSIFAFVDGKEIQSSAPALSVTSGNYSLSQSLISVSASSVVSGSAVIATLTVKDSSGNQAAAGGFTVLFSNSGGTSTGTFAGVTDHGDGTYTAAFTGAASGTATSIGATIQGNAVTSVKPAVTVFDIAPSSLAYSTHPATYTKGVAITSNVPSNAGGPLSSYSILPPLPSGLTLNPSTGVISGTPTGLSATTSYTVTGTNSGGSTTAPLSITVNDVAPSPITYSLSPAAYVRGTAIANNAPSSPGSPILGYSINPALPAGLSLSMMSGVISGTATVISPATVYTVTGTNSGGTSTASLTLTVDDIAPSALSYTTASATYSKGTTIVNNSPSNSGGPAVNYTVSPALPAGLNLNASTGVISGTPTAVSALGSYAITAANSGGSTSATISITVHDIAPSALTYSTIPATYTKGLTVANNSPANSGGVVTSYSVSPALPTGITLNASTGVITGTPSVISPTTAYMITASNTGGSTTASVSLTVNDAPPTALSYSLSPAVYTKSSAITNNSPANSGGAILGYSVSPALPQGLSLSAMSGIISGTPTAISSQTNYTITATNSGGTTSVSLLITVNDVSPGSLSYSTSPAVYTSGVTIVGNTPSNSGGSVLNYSISPSLPSGLSFNSTTGVISGTPLAVSASTNYTVTATDSGGSTSSTLSITVNDVAPSSLSYSVNPASYTKGSAITNNTPSSSGGAVTAYSIFPSLPAGLNFNVGTGVISGTPTAISSVTPYTVTATNSGGSTTVSISVTVNDIPPSALTYATNPVTYTKGSVITNNQPANSGGSVLSYSVSPSLPAGLSLSVMTGIISGTPSVISASSNYTITASNSGGTTTASISITVNDIPPSTLTYSADPAIYTKGVAITNNTPSSSGGAITGYSISPTLPAGLNFNATSGIISGTPGVIAANTTYTVTGTNSGSSVTAAVILTVNDVAPSSLTYATNPAIYTNGSAIATNSPTSSGGVITSYSISPSLPIGLSLNTSTGVISGTPTAVTGSTSYTINAVNSGGSTAASVSITVNDVTPSSLTYSTTPAVYTMGAAITNNSPSSTGGSVVSYSVSPSLPAGLSLNTSTGVISGTPTAITGIASYTVTALNSGGSATASVSITVNDTIPSNLSYSANPAVYTKNSGIANNAPSNSGGSVTSYSVTPALPAGIILNTSTGVISGTPTAITAVANYTVTATNSGGSTTASVDITVNDVAPSSLTYTTNPAIYTKSSAITNDAPSSSGGAIISYSVSPSLPSGLNLNTSSGVISGTPTTIAAAAFYTVIATNSGGSTTVDVSLTINDVAPSSLTYSTSPAVYSVGSAIINNSPANSGGAPTSYAVSPSLPPGLSLNAASGIISGTPSAITGTASYTVIATNSGGSTTASVSITVNDIAPSVLSYSTNPAVYSKSSAIANNSPSNSGGSVTSYSISPSLPTGLTLNSSTGVISGTPTAVTANASYTVTASNSGGAATASVSITVNDIAPSSLTYSTNPAVYTKNSAVTHDSPASLGGTVISYSVSPSLPAGLSFNTSTGVISGTPTVVTGSTSYTITATNSGGSTAATVTITVNDVIPSSLSYSTNPAVYTINSAITNNTPSNTGGSIISYSVSPNLPAGLSLNTTNGVISGTPTAITGIASYLVTATNSGGSNTVNVSITVNDVAPAALVYSINPAIYTKGAAITNNSPSSSGGSVTSYSISPSLPAGLSFSSSTGVISGTGTAVSPTAFYTVTAMNSGGNTTASVSITVNDVAPSSLTYATNPATYTKGSAIANNSPSVSGGAVSGYSVSPTLPAGLSLSSSTGVISGTPTTITSTANYTVTATNSGGSTTASVSITVNDVVPSSLAYSTNPAAYTKGSAITNDSPSASGGAITSYAISGALPAGLNFSTSTGVISGTPSVIQVATPYTVTATNSGGSTTVTVNITINDVAPSSLTYSTNPATYTKGTAITGNFPSVSGGTVTGYAVSPSLPAGLSINASTGVISGTPTAITANASYTVTATNSGGATTASVSLVVNDVTPSSLTYSANPAVYTKSVAITNNSPSSSGGGVTGYAVSPSLPAGLSMSATTGVISGTPTAIIAIANYTVTATNSGGSTTVSVSIMVNDVAPSSLTYSPATTTATKGSAIAAMNPSASGGAITGYSISGTLPAGLSLSSTTGIISGTPTVVQVSTPYTVTATNSGGSTTAMVNITVNDVAPSGLSYSASASTYTKGTVITNNSPSTSGGGALTGYAVSPALPAGLSISATTGVISGTPTVVAANASYTVTASNSGGSTTSSLSITVIDVAPTSLTYSTNPAIYTKNSAIANNTPSHSGGAIVSYSVSPALPSGLSLNTSTGVVSGAPTSVTANASYTVTATNTGGSTTASVSIAVNDVAPSGLSYSFNPATYTNGYAIANNTAAYSGGPILSFTVSPSLPAGLSLSVMTGTISGTPTAVAAAQTYVVTGTNSGGSTTSSVSITVANPTIAVSTNNFQTAAARSTLPSAFTAVVKDATGSVIASQTVDWAITAGGGLLSSAANSTNSSGLSSSTLTLGATAGSNTCTATIDGTSIAVTFTATATTSNFTSTWALNSGANFTYNSSKIDFSNGYAELTPASQTDNSNTGVNSFLGGSSLGTAWDTNSNSYMRLSQSGSATALELSSAWAPAWSNIVGYWKLNEASGSGTAADSGPIGTNTGTVTSGVTLGSSGMLNTAASFNGSNSTHINAGSANLPLGASPRSISLWLKPSSLPSSGAYACMVAYGNTNTDTGQFLCLTNSGSAAQIAYGGVNDDFLINYTMPTTAWTHLLTTFDGTTATIYVNGAFIGSMNKSSWNTTSAGIEFANAFGSNYPYTGSLDDIAIWNTALSASAVATIYQHEFAKYAGTFTSRVMDGINSTNWTTFTPVTTLPFFKELPDNTTTTPISESASSYSSLSTNLMSGIIGLYHLDETSWNGTAGEVKDASGNGNNGTASGNATTTLNGRFGSSGFLNSNSVDLGTGQSGSVNGSGAITVAAWVNPSSLPDYTRFVTRGANTCNAPYVNVFLGTWDAGDGNNANPRFALNLNGSLAQTPVTAYRIPLNQWSYIVGTFDGSTLKVFANGKLISSVAATGVIGSVMNHFAIGAELSGCTSSSFTGLVDEVGIWRRALGDGSSGGHNEILDLYRRGANRIKYQVRSCPDSTCSTAPSWLGPDGTNQTYFSELNNNAVPKDGGDLTASDSVNASGPAMTFANFSTLGLSVSNNRYFQYRAIMESDDTGTGCNYGSGATWCSPELRSASVGPNHYDMSNPILVNNTGTNFATLTSLLETLGTSGCGSGTLYNLSPDNANWYYLNGSTWTLAGGTVATATVASLITPSALSTFPSPGTVYFKVFLQSSGTSACTINSIAVSGTQ